RLLERAGADLDRGHVGAEQAHALHVGFLAAHVLGAHVDDALQAEQRARRRGGHAVLARSGLGDHPRLAHPPREQRLADVVFELGGAGVQQVLALEQYPPAGGLAQPSRLVQRRRAPGVVAQQGVELSAKGGIGPRQLPLRLELRERRHQRLGYVLPAVGPEAVLDRAHSARSGSGLTACAGEPSGSDPPRAAEKNASSLPGSLRPGSASTPLATSTAWGAATD